MTTWIAPATARPDTVRPDPGGRPVPHPFKPAPRRIDEPRGGFFLVRLVKGGPRVAARIVEDFGQFSAEVDGRPCGKPHADPLKADGVMRIWLYGVEIEREEYDSMLRRTDKPDPNKRVDLAAAKPVF